MTDLVDQMFPPIHRKWTPEFTDFNYWKVPLQGYALPDLSPPSPALSARSDTSNQSALARLREFRLGGNNSSRAGEQHVNIGHASTVEGTDNDVPNRMIYRNSHLRQMSSFERLSSTLAFMTGINNGDGSRRSASPELSSSSYVTSDDEDGDESELDLDGKPRTIRSRRSMSSMPGTLDEMQFDMDDDDEEKEEKEDHNIDHYEDEDEEDGVEEEVEEEFDDDLLAAGAMQKVPFLYE
jgi:phosphatidate phosphatase LPIN